MTSSKLIIIGNGSWPLKIQSVLNRTEEPPQIESISARNFLENSILVQNQFPLDAIIWIATRPELQLEILEIISQLGRKVIIEKPSAVNINQLETLRIILKKTKNHIYLSEPWKYSQIWLKTKSFLTKNLQQEKILVKRGGPEQRDFISPIWDWIPHDLGLITDFLQEIKSKPILGISSRIGDKQISICIEIPNRFVFEISSGFFETRTAFWETENGLHIDFINNSITQDKLEIAQFRSDQPLVNMYKEIMVSYEKPTIDFILTDLLLRAEQK